MAVAGVPDSCCIDYIEHCGGNIKNNPDITSRIWTVGCVPELAQQVQHKAGVFVGIGVGIAFIQVSPISIICFISTFN